MSGDPSFSHKYLLYFAISRFWLHLPIWVLFFSSKGFSLNQLALISNVMWLSVILFEIPTGYIADKFGRKLSLILSYQFQAIGIGIFVVSTTVPILVFAHILWGLGITMASGAESAWIYDESILQYTVYQNFTLDQARDRYERNYGRYITVAHLSLGISQILGGIVASYQLSLPHSIVAILFIVVSLLLWMVPESKSIPPEKIETFDNFDDTDTHLPNTTNSKSIMQILSSAPVLALAIIIVVTSSFDDIKYFMQDDVVKSGLSFQILGIFFAGTMLAVSLGSWSSKRFTRISGKASYLIIILIYSSGFVVMSYGSIKLVLVIFIMISFFRGVLIPIINTDINSYLAPQSRATALSVINIATKLSYIVFAVAVTGIIELRGFSFAYGITGILLLLSCLPSIIYLSGKTPGS